MRRLLLGVGGSVSLYKSVELIRRVQELGWNVTVIPTPASEKFVGRALWEAITENPVPTSLWSEVHNSTHIKLARNHEIFLVAPATINLIGKFANGIADDLLTTTFINFAGRKILVPAAHTQMWENQIVQENVKKLQAAGVEIIPPEVGALASWDFGAGRYPQISTILNSLYPDGVPNQPLLGKRVLITTGGTKEAIDPVRYIGNRSSGKQGLAFANLSLELGAEVELITTVVPEFSHPNLNVQLVESADEMLAAVQAAHHEIDFSILVAAVADKKPLIYSEEKIKKDQLDQIALQHNPDIALWIGENKLPNEKILLFAAETNELAEQAAVAKLSAKSGDLIYVNRVDGVIFGAGESEGVAITNTGLRKVLPRADKESIASELLEMLINL